MAKIRARNQNLQNKSSIRPHRRWYNTQATPSFVKRNSNSPSNGNPHKNNGGSNTIEVTDDSVSTSITKQYVNLQTTGNGNSGTQPLNQRLRSGITDSDRDTDYPRLYRGDCLSQNCCSGRQDGLINASLCMSPSSELDDQTETVNSLVQHTYHFPEVSKRGSHSGTGRDKKLNDYGHSMDSEDDSEASSSTNNCNYGHFVPVSQIPVDENKKDLTTSCIQGNTVIVI